MDYNKIKEHLNTTDRFCANNEIRITEVRQDYAETRLKIIPERNNALGVLQGGAIFTLADFAFAAAAAAKAEDDGKMVIAMNATISFIRPGTGSELRAEAHIINRGRQSCIADVLVFNDLNKLIAKLVITGFNFDPTKGKK